MFNKKSTEEKLKSMQQELSKMRESGEINSFILIVDGDKEEDTNAGLIGAMEGKKSHLVLSTTYMMEKCNGFMEVVGDALKLGFIMSLIEK